MAADSMSDDAKGCAFVILAIGVAIFLAGMGVGGCVYISGIPTVQSTGR
jgi:hypothetical protein